MRTAKGDNIKRFVLCSHCGAKRRVIPTCDDCRHSFTNPFDQRFCSKGKTATRLCKDFIPTQGD